VVRAAPKVFKRNIVGLLVIFYADGTASS